MKTILCLLFFLSAFSFGGEVTFRDRVYPLLQKSPTYCLLLANFDFHPSYVTERSDEESHTITTLVSYSPADTGSITWCHYVTFHLVQSEDDETLLSSIEFSGLGVNLPCFVPKEVISVDELGELTVHKVSIESQVLLPQVEQALKPYRIK